jgi:hypothetical protein
MAALIRAELSRGNFRLCETERTEIKDLRMFWVQGHSTEIMRATSTPLNMLTVLFVIIAVLSE